IRWQAGLRRTERGSCWWSARKLSLRGFWRSSDDSGSGDDSPRRHDGFPVQRASLAVHHRDTEDTEHTEETFVVVLLCGLCALCASVVDGKRCWRGKGALRRPEV